MSSNFLVPSTTVFTLFQENFGPFACFKECEEDVLRIVGTKTEVFFINCLGVMS